MHPVWFAFWNRLVHFVLCRLQYPKVFYVVVHTNLNLQAINLQ